MKSKIISSMEKVFLKDDFESFKIIKKINTLKSETIHLQLILKSENFQKHNLKFEINSKLTDYELGIIEYVPSKCPVYEQKYDEKYITNIPGLFPDPIIPLTKDSIIKLREYTLATLFISLKIPKDIEPKNYEFEITFTDTESGETTSSKLEIEILDKEIEENKLIYTNWLYADTISEYFKVDTFSKEHWNLINEFIKTAVKTGVNMLLTPIFTYPLDTAVGKERPTTQLIDISYDNGKYDFKYENFEHWIELAKENGIKYFELTHLFSQWGLEFTPKIIVNGEKKFGWHISSNDPSYCDFLEQFLLSIIQKLKDLNIYDNTFFHISDEPSKKRENDLKNYEYAKNIVTKYIPENKIMDALSNIEFYDQGLIKNPIPATNKITPFLENKNWINNRWTYYCCSQAKDVSNRFFSMPLSRTRILGIQLYINNIIGFLHWGFNFYFSELSKELIDPFKTTDADMAFPSGDPFIVYPFENSAIESIRSKVFYRCIQDYTKLFMLEEKIGRKETINFIKDIFKTNITFENYPIENHFFEEFDLKINNLLNS